MNKEREHPGMSNEKLKFEWVDNPDCIGERLFTFDGKKNI